MRGVSVARVTAGLPVARIPVVSVARTPVGASVVRVLVVFVVSVARIPAAVWNAGCITERGLEKFVIEAKVKGEGQGCTVGGGWTLTLSSYHIEWWLPSEAVSLYRLLITLTIELTE